jgi:GNAT superfamily N-acetyltransferase
VTSRFQIRLATQRDAPIIARHRAEMFSDMGQLPAALYDELVERTRDYLTDAIPRGEYVGWLAESNDGDVIAGAGVQIRRILPRPLTAVGEDRIAHGTQGLVLNVFTERAWRRQGLAGLLMQQVIEWAAATALDSLVLHASDDGRPMYERLGFVATNEMRYAKPLIVGDSAADDVV